MIIREIIGKLESEIQLLKKENEQLKRDIKRITAEKNALEEVFTQVEAEAEEVKRSIVEDVEIKKPVVEEVESQLTEVVTKVDADIIEDKPMSIDMVVNETPKPKRSRKKKVEESPIFVDPVDETENI